MLNGVSVFWGVFSCRKEELDAANKLNKQSSAWLDLEVNFLLLLFLFFFIYKQYFS